eukprot:CAMPEP_0168738066 /NCGR_PEP_ID=MMETSP0724-20121128/10733_1 /TAXON_ID=265536 /ORGANISM="Amphiprora sp., Strain CCMP467" /LENGTH=375 /DNA_ID=CAMNT_0008785381 /DNA_START=48 /DNA_END=1173 /DNA_ORIENTATION=+
MADNNDPDDNENLNGNDNEGSGAIDDLPWYEYPLGQRRIPDHVTHLRIGVQQAVVAAKHGIAPVVLELPDRFCAEHPNLQQVQIHVHTVEGVPQYAFINCSKLEKVEFVAMTGRNRVAAAAVTTKTSDPPVQSRLAEIGRAAFYCCTNLHSVIGLEHVSGSLELIGIRAFSDCGKLTALDLSCLTRLDHLGVSAFYVCASLTVVDLSNSVLLRQEINLLAFAYCKALKIIHLPPHLKRIRERAFKECMSLGWIVIPASLEFMGHYAFKKCSRLTKVTFQSTRHLSTLMHNLQFCDCSSLHTLKLQGPAISRELWPLLLEQFLQGRNGLLVRAGIRNGKQHVTIAWNFMRANIANFYVGKKKRAGGNGTSIPSISN